MSEYILVLRLTLQWKHYDNDNGDITKNLFLLKFHLNMYLSFNCIERKYVYDYIQNIMHKIKSMISGNYCINMLDLIKGKCWKCDHEGKKNNIQPTE